LAPETAARKDERMARAGYCSACAQNVYLDAAGGCVNGHAAEYVTNVYEVPDAAPVPVAPAPVAPAPVVSAPPVAAPYPVPAVPPMAPPYAAPVAPPKKKRTGLIIALVIIGLLLLCGCGIGTVIFFASNSSESSSSSSSSSSEPAVSATEKAKLETALVFVKSMVKGDAELMKSVMPAATVAAMPAEFWTSFVDSTAASAATTLGKETWDGASVTIEGQSDQGPGTMELSISTTEPNAALLHNVRADKSTNDSTIELVEEDGAWKVLSFASGDNKVPFEVEALKAYIEANQ
jgi:hypothetical protein